MRCRVMRGLVIAVAFLRRQRPVDQGHQIPGDNTHIRNPSRSALICSAGRMLTGCQDRRESSVEGPGRRNPFGWLIGYGGDAVVVVVVVEYRESGGFRCSGDHQIDRFRPAMLTGPG